MPVQERPASPSVASHDTAADAIATTRRSNASASIPPYSPARIVGTSATTPISATSNVDRVSA